MYADANGDVRVKDYGRVVVWLDYFNKNLRKSRGRRLGFAKCVFDPTIRELEEAAGAAGLDVAETNERARFPRRPYVRSGYIILPKAEGRAKGAMLDAISEMLLAKRAKAKAKKDKKRKRKK